MESQLSHRAKKRGMSTRNSNRVVVNLLLRRAMNPSMLLRAKLDFLASAASHQGLLVRMAEKATHLETQAAGFQLKRRSTQNLTVLKDQHAS